MVNVPIFLVSLVALGCQQQNRPPADQVIQEVPAESQRTPSAEANVVTRDSLNSAGTTICYSVAGKGEPVILLHGWFGNGSGMIETSVARSLVGKCRLIAPDLRGHGDSLKPIGTEHYGNNMVEDVVRLMDHLEIESAHFVGYSMGGMILTKLMVDHPGRVKSAVIGGTGGIRDYYDFRFAEVFADAVKEGLPTGEALIKCIPYTGDPDVNEERLEAFRGLNDLDGDVMASVPLSWKELEVSADELMKAQIPVMVLIGELDMPNNLRAAEEMPKLIPGCKFHKFLDTNHREALNHPDFVDKATKFLSSQMNR